MEHACCISEYQSLGRFVPRRRSWQTAQRTWQTWNQTKVSNVLKWYWPNFIEDITKMIATLRTHMKLVVTRRNGFATSARLFKLLNACRRVTPVVCCSLRDICEELRGTERNWEGPGGVGRNWAWKRKLSGKPGKGKLGNLFLHLCQRQNHKYFDIKASKSLKCRIARWWR